MLIITQVCFYNSRTEEVSSHTLRLPKEGCVSDLLAELQRQLGEEHSGRPLRLLEISYSRIYKVLGWCWCWVCVVCIDGCPLCVGQHTLLLCVWKGKPTTSPLGVYARGED